MDCLVRLLRILSVVLLVAVPALALPAPDCQFSFTFARAGQFAPAQGRFDNRLLACTQWTYAYSTDWGDAESVSVSVSFQYSEDGAEWSEIVTKTDTYAGGTINAFYPFMRVRINTLTGARSVKGTLYGFRNAARSGGGSSTSNAYAWWGTLTAPSGLGQFVYPGSTTCQFSQSGSIINVAYTGTDAVNRLCGYEQTVPGATWRAEVGFIIDSAINTGFPRLGFWLRDSAGAIGATYGCAPTDRLIEISRYNLPDAGYRGLDYSAVEYSRCSGGGSPVIFMRLEATATERIWSTSTDRVFWTERSRVAVDADFTPGLVGVAIHNGGAANRPLSLTVVHWSVVECPCT